MARILILGAALAVGIGGYLCGQNGNVRSPSASELHAVFPSVDLSKAGAVSASVPLATPVPYYGSELVHPDIYFNPSGWNGHRFWMAVTPYATSNTVYENPSIYCSDDGQHWITPPGVTNPLVPYPGVGVGYNSDPDLVNGLDGKLYLFFRFTTGSIDTEKVMSSADGSNWSEPVTVFGTGDTSERQLSPSYLFDGGVWTMYYVRLSDCSIQRRRAPSMTGPWSPPTAVSIVDPPAGKSYWHLDVASILGKTVLLIDAVKTGTASGGQLFLAWSGDGVDFTRAPNPVLAGTQAWDASVYRSTFMPMYLGSGLKLGIWYSALGSVGWRVGYTETNVLQYSYPERARSVR